jgi:hypothetical protein
MLAFIISRPENVILPSLLKAMNLHNVFSMILLGMLRGVIKD